MNIGPGPVPQDVHTSLIDALHGAMAQPHFDAEHKAEYAGILQTLMRRQAKMHQQARPSAGPGGAVYDQGPPTSEADTSALLAALFPPRPQLHAPALQQPVNPVSILAALGAQRPGFGGPVY